MKGRQLGFAFRDLQVQGLNAASSHLPTFGSIFNPSAMMEELRNKRNPQLKNILTGFEGVIQPGEMLRESPLLHSHTSFNRHVSRSGQPRSRMQHLP